MAPLKGRDGSPPASLGRRRSASNAEPPDRRAASKLRSTSAGTGGGAPSKPIITPLAVDANESGRRSATLRECHARRRAAGGSRRPRPWAPLYATATVHSPPVGAVTPAAIAPPACRGVAARDEDGRRCSSNCAWAFAPAFAQRLHGSTFRSDRSADRWWHSLRSIGVGGDEPMHQHRIAAIEPRSITKRLWVANPRHESRGHSDRCAALEAGRRNVCHSASLDCRLSPSGSYWLMQF